MKRSEIVNNLYGVEVRLPCGMGKSEVCTMLWHHCRLGEDVFSHGFNTVAQYYPIVHLNPDNWLYRLPLVLYGWLVLPNRSWNNDCIQTSI